MTTHFRWGTTRLFVALLFLTNASSALGQDDFEDVVVTGNVTKVVLCNREPGAWVYRFFITMQAKNVGKRPLIVSSAAGTVVYYRVASERDELGYQQYAHIGWITSGPGKDPKSAPRRPVAPFKTVSPGRSVDIEVDFRAIVPKELKPGPVYIQVIAENWPSYSDKYVAKLKQAWQSHGLLWAHSLQSQAIASTIPVGLNESPTCNTNNETSCPVYLMTVEVRLPNRDGSSELKKENFILYDNGAEQDIRYWTRIAASGEVVYALGYHPPVYGSDARIRRIRVVVRSKANKRLKARFSPTHYRATVSPSGYC